MKGISLTTNTLVVIFVAILVLAVIVYLMLNGSDTGMDWQAMYELGCLKLIVDCDADLNTIEVESKGERYSLQTICSNLELDEDTCRGNCGCLT
jgi:hypothetical protein